jgi:hypothetical protein
MARARTCDRVDQFPPEFARHFSCLEFETRPKDCPNDFSYGFGHQTKISSIGMTARDSVLETRNPRFEVTDSFLPCLQF